MIVITGKLYICPSPIGNLEDLTVRCIRILKEVDVVAAEDTRRTGVLLAHYGIKTQLLSFHQHSGPGRLQRLVAAMLAGKTVALVSDAGTPGISDPGQALVKAAIELDIEVDPLPGPCAAITALSASGFPLAAFTFYGFLPKKGLANAVRSLKQVLHPVVLYESPRRIGTLLSLIEAQMPERELFLARELTKYHQQLLRGRPAVLLNKIVTEELAKGEYTVVLGPSQAEPPQLNEDLPLLAKKHLEAGLSPRDAAREISAETGIPRQDIYRFLHKKKDT